MSLREFSLRLLRIAIVFGLITPTVWAQNSISSSAPSSTTLAAAATMSDLLDGPDDEKADAKPQEPTASASTNDSGPVGIVPLQRGFNASLVTTSQHDSAAGWQSLLTPNVAYRFNKYFSMNLGLPVYTYLLVDEQTGTMRSGKTITPVYTAETKHLLLGDTGLTGEFALHTKWLDYTLAGTFAMPTGDDADGLGAGQLTYNFNNHFEHSVTDWFTPDIELGIGDSPNLDDTRLKKSFTTTGEGAHFQAGATFPLWHDISFDAEAYEDLPLGTQTVTSVTTNGKKGAKLRLVQTTSQKSIGEDNGFLTSLDIPLASHVTLSGIYNRSLRNHDDTAGFSLTFLLRAPEKAAEAKDAAK